MTTFQKAHKFVAYWEGGFVNHLQDPGGATAYGISLRFLQGNGIDIDGNKKINIDDIKALTPTQAENLFKSYFWDYLKLEDIPPVIAVVLYDTSVNCGCGTAVKILQEELNKLMPVSNPLKVDGIIGQQTMGRLLEVLEVNSNSLVAKSIVQSRIAFHQNLANKSPFTNSKGERVDYRPFLKGWINRCKSLMEYVWGYE